MDELEALHQEVRGCTKCPLARGRTLAVPGEGPRSAWVMFVGEAPGFHEDRQGRPFVGAAGNFLNELLASIGLKREEVYITNIIKCRPPGNRDPYMDEIEACSPYLDRQVELINPKVIVTLGRYSLAHWLPNAKISQVHGKPIRVGSRVIFPMYHPAAALHQPALKRTVEEDFRKLGAFLAGALKAEEEEPPEEPRQLSLF
jgi:uracil-DNA glycosylase family 4